MRPFAWNSILNARRIRTNSTVGWRTNCGTLNSPLPRRSQRRARICTKISTSCATACLWIWPTDRRCKVSPSWTSRTLTAAPICGEILQLRNDRDLATWEEEDCVALERQEELVAKINSTVVWAKIVNYQPAASILLTSLSRLKVHNHWMPIFN